MSALVKTIKSRLTDDTIYPITKADAVYMGSSTVTTVEGQINDIKDIIGSDSLPSVNDTITSLIGSENMGTTATTITGAIAELDSKLTAKTKTVTGTTLSNGSIQLGLNCNTEMVVSVKSSNTTYRTTAVSTGSNWFGIVTTDSGTITPIANQSVTLTVRYLEI